VRQKRQKTILIQRRMLLLTALLPAAVNLLQAPVAAAGDLAWICPLIALPVGYALCKSVEHVRGWQEGSKITAVLCLVWGLVLLFFSAASYSHRLLLGLNGSGNRPLFLIVSLLLVLYLNRSDNVLLRTAKLFFPTVMCALGIVVVVALPAIQWDNLWPLDAQWSGMRGVVGLVAGTGQVISLAGYAIFTCLLGTPQAHSQPNGAEDTDKTISEVEPTEKTSGLFWMMAGGGVLAVLLLILLGAFGVHLTLRMDEPFLYLMGGAGLAGGFHRGEAVLMTLIAVGDLTLLALLARICAKTWERLCSPSGRYTWLPVSAALLGAIFLPDGKVPVVWERVVLPIGNLLFVSAMCFLAMRSGKQSRKANQE